MYFGLRTIAKMDTAQSSMPLVRVLCAGENVGVFSSERQVRFFVHCFILCSVCSSSMHSSIQLFVHCLKLMLAALTEAF